jgi:hypothetical protein
MKKRCIAFPGFGASRGQHFAGNDGGKFADRIGNRGGQHLLFEITGGWQIRPWLA